MKSEHWDISRLHAWEKNPRSIGKKELSKLVEQIRDLRQYKPLIVTPDGTVLGGNMRLEAYKELGLKEVWVSIVEPKNEKEMFEYALSDNDVVGRYNKEEVEALVRSVTGFDVDRFTLSMGTSIALDQLMGAGGAPVPLEHDAPVPIDTIFKYTFSFKEKQFKETLVRMLAIIEENNLSDNTEVFFLLKKNYEGN